MGPEPWAGAAGSLEESRGSAKWRDALNHTHIDGADASSAPDPAVDFAGLTITSQETGCCGDLVKRSGSLLPLYMGKIREVVRPVRQMY